MRDDWMTRGSRSLAEALSRRLLLVPEVKLDDDGQPMEGEIPGIAERLVRSLVDDSSRSILRAFESRWFRDDYRFVEVLDEDDVDEASDEPWRERYALALEEARATLVERVERAEESIEQATVDGILLEAERTEFVTALSNISGDELLNFGPLFDGLTAIQERLEDERNYRMEALAESWSSIRPDLEETLPKERLTVVDNFVRRAIDQRDTRVMEEAISRLRESGDVGTIDEWLDPPAKRDVFVEYCDVLPHIEAILKETSEVGGLRNLIASPVRSTIAGLKTLSVTAREDAGAVLEVWAQLKERTEDDLPNCVKTLLRFLGFPDALQVAAASTTDRLTCFRADVAIRRDDVMDYTFARPIPQLGSLARGRYDPD